MSTTPTGATITDHLLAPLTWIGQHFQRHRSRSMSQFVLYITAEFFLINLLLFTFIDLFILPQDSRELSGTELGFLAFIAPFFETWLLQALPVWLASRFKLTPRRQILSSMIVFSITHFLSNGLVNFLTAGLIGGFYLAFSYVHWRQKAGTATAFMLTSTVHLLYNSIIVLLYLFARNVAGG